jgi:predicted Zn-dependent protease
MTQPTQPTRPTQPMRPQDLVERALALSRTDGCVVVAEETSSTNLRWAGNTLTTNGEMRGRSLTVIATVDGVAGTASGALTRSNVRLDEIEAVVRAAEAAARSAEPAQDARPLVTAAAQPPSSSWDDDPVVTSSAVFAAFAPALGAAFERARVEGRELFGYADHDHSSTYLGSSAGLRLRHDQPAGRVEVTGKSHQRSRSTYVGQTTPDFADVDVSRLEAEVVRRLGWADRTVEIGPGRYDTVLPPTAVADLMIYLYWSAAAREAHDGQTVFSKPGGGTRVGDRLSRLPLRMWSDPAHPGLRCAPFVLATSSGPASSVFDNGLPLGVTDWVSDGVLAALLQTRATAELTSLPVTPGIDNLLLEVPGATGTTDELVAATSGRALLLTCLWYIREVDPQTLLLTGLTRDGVHVVEDGEVIGTATNFRFNESPVALLDRIQAASATQPCLPREWGDYFTRVAMPALRVEGFNMSTVSPAS